MNWKDIKTWEQAGAYVATLEARIKELEAEVYAAKVYAFVNGGMSRSDAEIRVMLEEKS